jgi:ACR3 family arsenite efflux pump ArsB
MFGVLGWFYLDLLPGWLGLATETVSFSPWEIALSVVIFLGIPLAAGYLSRKLGERTRGREWYENTFLTRVGPIALYGLLFTIVVLFALQGETITSRPLDVARIALPLLVYFAIMWAGSYALGKAAGLSYARTTTLAFTAACNKLRAGDRRRDRRLRADLGAGSCRCGRAADRSSGARRARVRQPVAASPLEGSVSCWRWNSKCWVGKR